MLRAALAATLALAFVVPAQAQDMDPEEALGVLYGVTATVEYCEFEIEQPLSDEVYDDIAALEDAVGLTEDLAQSTYDEVYASVEEGEPDCSEGGAAETFLENFLQGYSEGE